MARGTISSIRADRGFGFIAPEGGTEDIFFHGSNVEGTGFDSLREGQAVEFVAGIDSRNAHRNRAEHVHLVEAPPMSEYLPLTEPPHLAE